MHDPLAGSPWSAPSTVQGFRQSPPNATLTAFGAREQERCRGGLALDIGCGAARNTLPLARQGWRVTGVDLSRPMLESARARVATEDEPISPHFVLATMEDLPFADCRFDFIVAHGIWNLARSSREFRRGVGEAARVAARGAALFVFTFSRHTLPAAAQPVPGESFVFTQFSGQPQCFLGRDELIAELGSVGFALDPSVPMREHNLPPAGAPHVVRTPVIHEAAFRRT